MSEKAISTLTDREREVFDLCVMARSNVEIAKKLKVSVKTVETHRQRVNRKLGVQSPAELILFAVREGILTRSMLQ